MTKGMTGAVTSIPASLPASRVYEEYFSSPLKHRGFPVVDAAERLVGVVTMSDLMEDSLLEKDLSLTARDLVKRQPIVAYPHETCRQAAERMAASGIGRLPVLSADEPGKLIGILTRSDLLKPRLQRFEEEKVVERHLGGKTRPV